MKYKNNIHHICLLKGRCRYNKGFSTILTLQINGFIFQVQLLLPLLKSVYF